MLYIYLFLDLTLFLFTAVKMYPWAKQTFSPRRDTNAFAHFALLFLLSSYLAGDAVTTIRLLYGS